jgi:hypothetical protein
MLVRGRPENVQADAQSLRLLVEDGLLKVVEKGKGGTSRRRSSYYRWLPTLLAEQVVAVAALVASGVHIRD